ncbi:MAG: HAMP domain-containing histidine kinase [Burkholderiales bacterium]|nr:HAMP domain-containing histidine kinase [Anaerolineae bacterium]
MTANVIPTNQDFATEVRADRLTTLWRATFATSLLIFWVVLTIATLQRIDASRWLGGLIAIAVGCLGTRFLLARNIYVPAVWSYTIGALAGVGIMLTQSDQTIIQLVPFVFPLLVFMIGLLLSPSNSFLVTVLSAVVVVIAPALGSGGFGFFGPYQMFAIALAFASSLLAAQVTGELYQITEWALLNYQRERRTGQQLFENRLLLERSLLRSTVLGETLQQTNVELESARQAAEAAKHFRGQFLANMSHELRTPLNAIIGFSETMMRFPEMYDQVILPDAYIADMNQIFSSGKQLLTLINDILDLSRVDAGKLEIFMKRVDLSPILRQVQSLANGLIGAKPIKLDMVLPDLLPDVWADEQRVRQVLINLYSNAVKFTDAGTITLKVHEPEKPDEVHISVTDTGGGIDNDYLELIFEEFKQSVESAGRDPRSGAGLGLSISRQLLGLMDGRIWAESQPGAGSTFHVILQSYRQQDAEVEQTALKADPEMMPKPAEVQNLPLPLAEKQEVLS